MQALLSFLFFTAALCDYTIISSWENSDCTGKLIQVTASFDETSTCTAVACATLGFEGITYFGKTECGADALVYGTLDISLTTYNETQCQGPILLLSASLDNTCIPVDSTSSYLTNGCGTLQYDTSNCTGTGTDPSGGITVDGLNNCIDTDGQSAQYACGSKCFHEDTLISYQGTEITLAQLQASEAPICVVPHVVLSNGVKITTTCPGALRLTDDHLVYTHDGLKSAANVKVGDFLYSDIEEKNTCEVTKIEIELGQKYFGLNCEDSEVLANGYKTSTFGIFHQVPAAWMKYASKILGVSGASSLGDSFATFFSKLRLI